MKKLCVLLTDPMQIYYTKGEIKDKYYNPENFFDEIHLVSFCQSDIETEKVRAVAGTAKLYIHSIGNLGPFNFIKVLLRTYHILNSTKPDIIRAYDPSLRGALAVFLSKQLKIPVVVSIHTEFDAQRKFDRRLVLQIRRFFENYSLQNADCVIAVTKYVAEYASRHKAKKVEIVHNSISNDLFNSADSRTGGKKKNILCVARFEKPKRQDIIIKAIKNLDVNLVFIGEGYLKKRCFKLAKRYGVSEKISFLGSIPHTNINNYFINCDIFALASDFEGFCIPIIEAMAVGKPIVASDIPAIQEIVDGGGILVKNCAEEFNAAFKRLINDAALCREIGNQAREKVKIFDSVITQKKERIVYANLLKL